MKTKFYLKKHGEIGNFISLENGYSWIGNTDKFFGYLTKKEALKLAKNIIKKFGRTKRS